MELGIGQQQSESLLIRRDIDFMNTVVKIHEKEIQQIKTKTVNLHLHAHTFPGITKTEGGHPIQVCLSIRL
jgi:ribosomal protein S13